MARLKKSEHPVSSDHVKEDTRESGKRSASAGLFLLRGAIMLSRGMIELAYTSRNSPNALRHFNASCSLSAERDGGRSHARPRRACRKGGGIGVSSVVDSCLQTSHDGGKASPSTGGMPPPSIAERVDSIFISCIKYHGVRYDHSPTTDLRFEQTSGVFTKAPFRPGERNHQKVRSHPVVIIGRSSYHPRSVPAELPTHQVPFSPSPDARCLL